MGELLGSRSVRIGMALFLLQQASGINAIVYFSSSVFAQARRLGPDPRPGLPARARGTCCAPPCCARAAPSPRANGRAGTGAGLRSDVHRACMLTVWSHAVKWVVHAVQNIYLHSYSRVGLPHQGTLRTITVACTRAPTQSRGTRQQCAGRRAQAGIASAALASAAVGVTNVVGTVVAASLMDRAGRKQLLALSFGGMGLSMLAMAAGLGLPSLAPYAGPVALVRALARGRGAGGPGVVCADAASLQSLCVQHGAGGPRTGAAVVGAGSAAAGRARAARGARGLSLP